jgi:hypothetical protein
MVGPGEFRFPEGGGTLSAVIVGAILATVGGLAATQLESIIRRRERERSAALLFGEILAALGLITQLADAARARGDPYGPFTTRLLRAAQREAEIYDRNREALYELRDAGLRARIHTVMVRITLALDGVFDAATEIPAAEHALRSTDRDHPEWPERRARLDALCEQRQAAFDFAVEIAVEIRPLHEALRPIAKYDFGGHETAVREARAAALGPLADEVAGVDLPAAQAPAP